MNINITQNVLAVCAIIACNAVISSPSGAAESPILPAYQKLWDGTDGTEYPEGMANPKDLHSLFISEGQNYSWSSNLEKEINQSLNNVKFGKISAKSVDCRSTICEVMVKINKSTIKEGADAGKELSVFAGEYIYPVAQRNNLESTIVISSSPDDSAVGSLIYIYVPKH